MACSRRARSSPVTRILPRRERSSSAALFSQRFVSSRGIVSHRVTIIEWRSIHEVLPVGMLGCNCSVIGDEISREAIVIDPGDDVSEIIAILERHQLTVKMIVITHAHIDHIGGAEKLRALHRRSGLHARGGQDSERPAGHAGGLARHGNAERPGDRHSPRAKAISFARGRSKRMCCTPRATRPAAFRFIFRSKAKVIAGDTLFQGSIGRTDLPGGDTAQIGRSIRGKLYTLPEDTIVFPGPRRNTSIGEREAAQSVRAGVVVALVFSSVITPLIRSFASLIDFVMS